MLANGMIRLKKKFERSKPCQPLVESTFQFLGFRPSGDGETVDNY